jgi:O-antigen ligase
MAILLSAIVALLPLILTPQLMLYYDITPKIAVLLLGTAVAVPLSLWSKRRSSAGLRLFGILLIAQAASLVISTGFSTDVPLSLGGSTWRRFGLVTQIALLIFVWLAAQYVAGDPMRVRGFLRVIAISGIPAAAYGILQYFGWDPLIDPSAYHMGEAPFTIVRPPGTLGYVSYFATYLLSVIFSGAALAIVEERRAWKIAGAAAGVIGAAGLILTGTRAAMLGLICGAIVFLIRLKPGIRRRAIGVVALCLAATGVFYFSSAGQMLRSRTRWFVEDAAGGARLLLWRDSLRMAAGRWPVGFGPETFSKEFPRYQSIDLARAQADFYQESPHNIFVDALAAQGVAGFAILLGVVVLGFYAAWRSPHETLSAAMGAMLVALAVSQQFTSFIAPTAVFFYLTVALLVAHAFTPLKLSVYNGRLAIFGCTMISVLLIAFAMSLVISDISLARVERMTRAGHTGEAAALYQRFEPWRPPGMRTDLWYSRLMAAEVPSAKSNADAVAAWQQGLVAAVRAARNAEEPQNAWFNLAVFYGQRNDHAHTEQALRAAISSAPNWFKPHWILAQVLGVEGRFGEALLEAERAADLNGGKNPEVMRTATEIRALSQSFKK